MCFSTGQRIGLNIVVIIIVSFQVFAQDKLVSINGHVDDAKTNSPLVGVNVAVLQTSYGTTTDTLGIFSLSLKSGKYRIQFSYVGYEAKLVEISVTANDKHMHLSVSLKPGAFITNEVIVSADKYQTSPSLHVVQEKDLQYIPNLFSDVLRSVTILPGVSSNNELTSAYNVRGQNFDANLIYLNGFEIYRPYLVQQGIEENQSAINGNMVSDLEFYDGAFPVEFGDKMSSVLVVNYKNSENSVLGGEVNADLLNLGATLHDNMGGLSWIAGFRYAYPSSFTNVLQTKGAYMPKYTDFQFLGSYTLPNNIKTELLVITANNSFDLTPQNWTGNFQVGAWYNFNQISLDFTGTDNYRYNSDLLGLKVTTPLNSNSLLTTSLAYYSDREFYNENLTYDAYYAEDALGPYDNGYSAVGNTYLETGYEYANNSLLMNRVEVKTEFNSDYGSHDTKAGITVSSSSMDNSLDESTYYTPATIAPSLATSRQKYTFNSVAAYLGEDVHFNAQLTADLGLRALKYYFNGEFLVSPRASFSFQPDSINLLSFGWGYYYQPPYFYETRDKSPDTAKSLLSQRAIHYIFRYENKFRRNADFVAEVFYKSLDKLMPYSYTNQLELTYGDSNNYEGYAYGFDLQYEGELVEGLDTWIGYDYLNAQERKAGGTSPYQPSLLDQTHTIRIFLQDAMPKIPNSQAHVRLLFGTGYLYHPLVIAPSTSPTPTTQMVPDYNNVEVYPFYFRVDMGLTYKFVFEDERTLIFTADVLNVFDKQNIVSYSWYFIPQESTLPIQVPNILSKRYFNIGARVEF